MDGTASAALQVTVAPPTTIMYTVGEQFILIADNDAAGRFVTLNHDGLREL